MTFRDSRRLPRTNRQRREMLKTTWVLKIENSLPLEPPFRECFYTAIELNTLLLFQSGEGRSHDNDGRRCISNQRWNEVVSSATDGVLLDPVNSRTKSLQTTEFLYWLKASLLET